MFVGSALALAKLKSQKTLRLDTRLVSRPIRTSGSEGVECYPSNQPHPLQTRMPVLADDDVVVHGDAERGGDVDDRFGHLDVGLRRRRIAGGVVVHQTTRLAIAMIPLGFCLSERHEIKHPAGIFSA